MKTTLEYIDTAKAALNLSSDYALAKWLGVRVQAMSNYRTGERIIDDYAAAKIAEALKIDPLEVIAAANMEREKDSKRRAFWQAVRERGMAAALAVFAVFSTTYNTDTQAEENAYKSTNYTLCVSFPKPCREQASKRPNSGQNYGLNTAQAISRNERLLHAGSRVTVGKPVRAMRSPSSVYTGQQLGTGNCR